MMEILEILLISKIYGMTIWLNRGSTNFFLLSLGRPLKYYFFISKKLNFHLKCTRSKDTYEKILNSCKQLNFLNT